MNHVKQRILGAALMCSIFACGDQTTATGLDAADSTGAQFSIPTADTASVVDSAMPPAPQPTPAPPTGGEPCVDVDATVYPSCCDNGPARCVPEEFVAPRLKEFLGTCENGGICVPELILPIMDAYTPLTCSSVAGLPGACMSACVPDVQGFISFLSQDICTEGELCVPCVNPLDQTETGVCQTLECNWDYVPETTPEPEPEPQESLFDCDNPPPIALVDPEMFPSCCEGAHCVPNSLVPGDLLAELDACPDGASACVPDDFVKYNGIFTPPSCTAPGDLEGRCLSECLPSVFEKIDKLVQGECGDFMRCVPCCDPITGENTGACEVGCDTGPASGVCEIAYEECCKGAGHCIPEELIPGESMDNLRKKTCDKDYMCVPDVLQDENPVVSSCTGNILFQEDMAYIGVCLPKCLKIPMDILIWSGTCGKNDDCVPCVSPLDGSPTDAPGCP